MKNIFLVIFFFTLYSLNSTAQPTRVVYWLHGLGGDEAAWTQAVTATAIGASNYPSRRLYSYEIGYENQNYSLATAATYVQQQVANDEASSITNYGLSNRANNFMIAHS